MKYDQGLFKTAGKKDPKETLRITTAKRSKISPGILPEGH